MTAQRVSVVILLFSTTVAQLTWTEVQVTNTSSGTPSLPPTRRDHALGYDIATNQLVLFGGRGNIVYGDTWLFDMAAKSWRQVTLGTKPPARFSMVYGISNGAFYVSTGQEGANLYNDIWKFNISSETWTELPSSGTPPAKVYGGAGGFFNGSSKFYMSHGFSSSQRYANTFIYDLGTMRWSEVFPDASSYDPSHPHARCLVSGAMVDEDKLVIYGGCLSGGKTGGHCPSFDSWIFNGKSREWSRYPNCASARTYSSLALLPSSGNKKRVVLYGGNEKGGQVLITKEAPANQVAVLNIESEEWVLRKVLGSKIPKKRVGTGMASHPNGIYMFGGSEFNDLWFLEGDSDKADNSATIGECIAPFKGFFNLIMLHVVFMFSGWGILLQAGAFIARYFRFKDPLWFHLHRICQVSGLVLGLAGLICAGVSVQFDHFNFAHGGLGIVIMILGFQQPINAIFRPHKVKGEPVAMKRTIWEFVHINSGRLALILSVVNISLGLYLELASTATLILWYVYVVVVVIVYIVMEVRLQLQRKKSSHEIIQMDTKQY